MDSILIIVCCLFLSAFFNGMEIAFISANRLRMELDKKQGLYSSYLIDIMSKTPSQYIASMLIGNNIVLVIYGILMAEQLQPWISSFTNNELYTLLIQTIFSTLVILVAAEFIPKALFRIIPNWALNFFSIPVFLFYIISFPIAKFVISISHIFLRRALKREDSNQKDMYIFGKIDLDHLVQDVTGNTNGNEEDDNEIKIFRKALDFSKVKVRDCMVPGPEIVAMNEDCTVEEIKQKFIETGFSRIIVFHESIDNITGYINSKELFKNPHNLKTKIVKAAIVPETMNANKLLKKLLQEHKSLAVVVDEFGGTSGIITIEDIIEEIFGEIEDEHDTTELVEKTLSDTGYIFSGRLSIDYLNNKYSFEIPESDEYETLAGFILYSLGRIPELNEKLTIEPFTFKIMRAINKRIDLVYMKVEKK